MPPKRAKPIGKQPLYERVRQSIENRVQLGEYSTERPLPSVGALAEEFDVSEITVRRALSDLRNAGVLRAVPSLGTFVHHIEKFVRNSTSATTSSTGHWTMPTISADQSALRSEARSCSTR